MSHVDPSELEIRRVLSDTLERLDDSGYLDWRSVLVAVKEVTSRAVSIGASPVDIRQAVEEALQESSG